MYSSSKSGSEALSTGTTSPVLAIRARGGELLRMAEPGEAEGRFLAPAEDWGTSEDEAALESMAALQHVPFVRTIRLITYV